MDHTIVHFEIPAKDVEKLRKFYAGVFGWNIDKAGQEMGDEMEYWLLGTVPVDKQGMPMRPGVNGGMYKKTDAKQRPVNYISVENADEYTEKIKKLGGKIIVPKQEVPHVGWVVTAEDPEGNAIAILQPMQ